MVISADLLKLREENVVSEIQNVLKVIANWMAIPLYLAFWLADLIYMPQYKWQFLAIRLSVVPICWIVLIASKRSKSYFSAQVLACCYTVIMAAEINSMIAIIGDPTTIYYAGLNMVAIAGLTFIPFSRSFYILTIVGIYAPYYIFCIFAVKGLGDLKIIAVNSFFITGSITICVLVRHFNEKLRMNEVFARKELEKELTSREVIILEKTMEAVRVNSLSSQFSPQVVRAIREGRVDLDKGVHRAQICAIFVDIVGSTERVVRLDKDKIDLVLARFMDTVVSTFLKYDITIDKFQGDGILAFSNDPIPYDDFVTRTCYAAIQVREKLNLDRDFYIRHWKKEMQTRMGISMGYANVGFYGNKKFFKCYTAIGAPLPYASRLTNLAEPNQILVDADIAEIILKENFNVTNLGEKVIKGFEDDCHVIYGLNSAPAEKSNMLAENLTCPHCPDSVLYLDTDKSGFFIMKCRDCEYIMVETPKFFETKKIA